MSHKGANPEQKPWHPVLQLHPRFPSLWKDRLHGTLSITDSLPGHSDLDLGREARGRRWGKGVLLMRRKGRKGLGEGTNPNPFPNVAEMSVWVDWFPHTWLCTSIT